MQINGIQGENAGSGQVKAAQTTDSVSKNIRNQITNLQKQMQELSSNKDMGVEEKMKRRQELQKQIFELQNQLRQHEIELRKESQQEEGTSMEEMLGGDKQEQTGETGANFSYAGMQAMISADSALSQAKTQGSVARSLKGRAGILETEIKLDGAREASVGMKQGELAALEERAMRASASQISSLGSAVNAMKEAAKEEPEEVSAKEGTPESTTENDVSELASVERSSELSMAEKYNPVDILL